MIGRVAARVGFTPRARTIARTDIRMLRQSRDFWLPLTIMATLFFVVLPLASLGVITMVDDPGQLDKLRDLVRSLPDSVRAHLPAGSPREQAGYAVAAYVFAPLAIIVPLTVSSAMGAHTIVGERERGSGEFLAHSPASEREIYLGKLAASLVPGYFTAAVGFAAYTLIVNLVVGTQLGGWFFPTGNWWLLMLWILPPGSALALGVILSISARVSSAMAAQQASALVTLPLIVIAYMASSDTLGRTGAVVIGALAWIAAIIVLRRAAGAVRRERLLGT